MSSINDRHYACHYQMPRIQFDQDPDRAKAHGIDYLRHHMAHHMATMAAEKIIDNPEYRYVEFKLEAYVVPAHLFWDLVHLEAQKIAHRYMPR